MGFNESESWSMQTFAGELIVSGLTYINDLSITLPTETGRNFAKNNFAVLENVMYCC